MLALALALDFAFGEPKWLWSRLPHPAVLLGRLVGLLDRTLNRGANRRLRGVLALAILAAAGWGAGAALSHPVFQGVFEILGAAILLAHRSLAQHVGAVAAGLGLSLEMGRSAVAMIVGRDPQTLDEAGVARAAIESAAENFSDGVLAPAFWFAVGGLPAMVVYKAVNTADSMIGRRTARYAAFGWAAARCDDLLNLVPARLTGLLFCIVGGRPGRALRVMLRDAPTHRSPNAGWPEAAMAAALGLALAGPRVYDGAPTEDPFLNAEARRVATAADIQSALKMLLRAWLVLFAAAAAVMFIGAPDAVRF